MWRRASLLAAYLEQPNHAARALPCTTWAIVAATMKRQQTLAAVKVLAYFCLALCRVQDPRPGLPWRLMTLVLGVAAGEYGNPMLLLILSPANDR